MLRDKKIFTNPDSSNNGWGSATDGDLDAAYALLLAGQSGMTHCIQKEESRHVQTALLIMQLYMLKGLSYDNQCTHFSDIRPVCHETQTDQLLC